VKWINIKDRWHYTKDRLSRPSSLHLVIKAPMALPKIPSLVHAIALSLMGILLLDSMGAIIKHLVTAYPAQQLSAFRNFFGLFPSILILLLSSEWHETGRKIWIRQWKIALSRGLFVAFAQFFFYLSLYHLALATASTLAFAGPLFVTALSVPILGDRVGAWRWLAVAVGFVGVVFILRPGSDVFTAYALLPIGAALGYALSAVSVRLITDPMPSATINLYSHVGALFGSTVFMLATSGYRPVASPEDWLWIVAMGTAGGFGVLFLVMAYRRTKPSNLAPFDYFGIPFAFALGWIFFAEAPFDTLFPGFIFVVAGGLMIFWRERKQAVEVGRGPRE
jgi:drug/metabolite transporter (DMT)-like permease